MIIRRAELRDVAAIAAIWNREIRDGISTFNSVEKTLAGIREQIETRGEAFIIAERSGQVIGFATYFTFRSGVGYAHTMEHTIHLDQTARGQGTGRALMRRLEATARANGVHVLIAGIGGENAVGIAFHKAIGFAETGRLAEVGRKFDRWMDLVLMHKKL